MSIDVPSRSELWSESIQGYEWPEEVQAVLNVDAGFSFDEHHLLKLASSGGSQEHFVLTFLSCEYLPLGLLWARFAQQASIGRFAIAATDSETAAQLQKYNIPFVEVQLPARLAGLVAYRNRGGFDGKALALIYSRLRIVRFLIEKGIDVLCCDIDALILRNPQPFLANASAMAFQRVVYFPKALARVWGFTACAGFVAYRATNDVSALLSRVLEIQEEVSSDQLALNLALLEKNVQWDLSCENVDAEQRFAGDFMANADRSIFGSIPGTQMTLEALPATTFWRHQFIQLNSKAAVILHPNSPKSAEGKLTVFSDILGAKKMRRMTREER